MIAGILFTGLNKAYRLLSIQVFIAFAFELGSFLIGKKTWVINCYLPIDCGILLLVAHSFLQKKNVTNAILAGYALFLITYIGDIYTKGIKSFAVNAFIVDAILQLTLYLAVMYDTAIAYRGSIVRLHSFWLCLGIVIFYGCVIPFFSMLDVLNKYGLSNELFYLLKILNNIRYLFVAASFYLCYHSNKMQPSN